MALLRPDLRDDGVFARAGRHGRGGDLTRPAPRAGLVLAFPGMDELTVLRKDADTMGERRLRRRTVNVWNQNIDGAIDQVRPRTHARLCCCLAR